MNTLALIEERIERARRENLQLRRARRAYLLSPELQAAYPSLADWLRCLRAAMAVDIPPGQYTARFL